MVKFRISASIQVGRCRIVAGGQGGAKSLRLIYPWRHIVNPLSGHNDCYGLRKRCNSIAISGLQTEDDCRVIRYSGLRLDTV